MDFTLELTKDERRVLRDALGALTTDVVWATDEETAILERILEKL